MSERRTLPFGFTVEEHYVFNVLSFFTSALIGGPVEYIRALEGATAPAELCILLQLPIGVHAFVADVSLLSFV